MRSCARAQVKRRVVVRKPEIAAAVVTRKMSRIARKASRSSSVASIGKDAAGGAPMTFVGGEVSRYCAASAVALSWSVRWYWWGRLLRVC